MKGFLLHKECWDIVYTIWKPPRYLWNVLTHVGNYDHPSGLEVDWLSKNTLLPYSKQVRILEVIYDSSYKKVNQGHFQIVKLLQKSTAILGFGKASAKWAFFEGWFQGPSCRDSTLWLHVHQSQTRIHRIRCLCGPVSIHYHPENLECSHIYDACIVDHIRWTPQHWKQGLFRPQVKPKHCSFTCWPAYPCLFPDFYTLWDRFLTSNISTHTTSYIMIHDIKPDNFVMGMGKHGNQVNVIDIGPAKKFCDPKTHLHILYRESKNLMGIYCLVHIDQRPFGHWTSMSWWPQISCLCFTVLPLWSSSLTGSQDYCQVAEIQSHHGPAPLTFSAVDFWMNLAYSWTTLMVFALMTNLTAPIFTNSSVTSSCRRGASMTMYLTGVSSEEPKMTKQQDPAPKQVAQEGARLFKRVKSIVLAM